MRIEMSHNVDTVSLAVCMAALSRFFGTPRDRDGRDRRGESGTNAALIGAVEQGAYQAFRRALEEHGDKLSPAAIVMASGGSAGTFGAVPGATNRIAPNIRYGRPHQGLADPLPYGLRPGEPHDPAATIPRHDVPNRHRRGPNLISPPGPERPMPEGAGQTDPRSFKGQLFRGESGGDPGIYNFNDHGRLGRGHFDADKMTIGELQRLQHEGRINAAGKYQIIPGTMQGAVDALGLRPEDKFDSAMQDRIFTDWLADGKRPQIRDYITGKSGDLGAAHFATAQEWASVDYGGHTLYGGHNKGSISDAAIRAALQRSRALYQRLVGEGVDPETARRAALLGIEHPTNVRRQQDAVPDRHAAAPIGDRAALDAQMRQRLGTARPGDAQLLRDYREQQNRPRGAADAGEDRATRAQQRDAERAVLPRRSPTSAPADAPERHAGIDMRVAGLDELREAHHHVDALHRKLAGLGNVRIGVQHHGFGHQGEHAPGAVRTALNGRFGSDGRAWG